MPNFTFGACTARNYREAGAGHTELLAGATHSQHGLPPKDGRPAAAVQDKPAVEEASCGESEAGEASYGVTPQRVETVPQRTVACGLPNWCRAAEGGSPARPEQEMNSAFA